jgi:hypothetical protein
VKCEYRKAPRRSAINRLFIKPETCGSVTNKKGVVGEKKAVGIPENIDCIERALIQRHRKSVSFSQELNFTVSSTYRIIQDVKTIDH